MPNRGKASTAAFSDFHKTVATALDNRLVFNHLNRVTVPPPPPVANGPFTVRTVSFFTLRPVVM